MNRLRVVQVMAVLLTLASQVRAEDGFVDHFDIPKDRFISHGKNTYCNLEPGFKALFEGKEDGKPGKLIISVLDETKLVDGVETRVVEEREWSDGKLIEVSRNYFAVDKQTNDIYYFGESVDMYEDGKITGHGGSWESGKDGAHFGLFMYGEVKVGQKYYQEVAPKIAMDRAENVSVTEKETVPAGKYEKVLKTKETTPLEPDNTEYKWYAPEVGLIIDGGLKLVKAGMNILIEK